MNNNLRGFEEFADDVIDFSGLGDFIHLPLKTYSQGMAARLLFAVLTGGSHDCLAMDEGFGAGDNSFYEKAQDRMTRFLSSAGTLLLTSHSEELLRRFCRRGLVFDSGRLVFAGPLESALDYYHSIKSRVHWQTNLMMQVDRLQTLNARASVSSTMKDAWRMRRAWWFTATARTRARFARTLLGSFWLGLSMCFRLRLWRWCTEPFLSQDFSTYVVYLGIGLVVWNGISAALGSAPNLFEHNQAHVQNTNLNPIFYVLEEWAFRVQTFLSVVHFGVASPEFFSAQLAH